MSSAPAESKQVGPRWRVAYRVIDLLTGVGHFVGYVFIGVAGYVVLIPIMVLAQIRTSPFRNSSS